MPHALHDQLAVQSPVNRLNGYSFLTALGFASGVRFATCQYLPPS